MYPEEGSSVPGAGSKYYMQHVQKLVCLVSAPAQADLMRADSTPSVHSLVDKSFSPYSSPRLIALGFRGKT